jgi:glucosamine--fructose-6-phosphate aminotransferase (isomerizing)
MAAGASLHDACLATLPTLRGTFGLAAISPLEPEKLVIARRGSPIMVAEVAGGWIVASDRAPFAGHAESCLSLHDHELALLEPGSMKVNSPTGGSLARGLVAVGIDLADTTPGSFPNFMAKEIHEQPLAIRRCLAGRLVADQIHSAGMRTIDEAIGTPERIVITGCGSAWHAGLIGAQMIESLAGIPTEVHVASELRHREIPVSPGTLCVAVSQSGETADTLEAMRELARQGATTFGVVNVVASALAQDTDAGMYLHAGPEVGVASTKAFTAQIAALALMAASLSPAGAKRTEFLRSLANLPDAMARAVETETAVRRVAERLAGEENWLFLGRGINWPVALEGALKLKEISYRHAEGLPAAEVKHGPLALVRPGLPVVLVAPSDHTAEKMLGTIAEVKARGAHTVVITDGVEPRLTRGADDVILLPAVHRLLSPLVTTIPLQWLSYHTARILGHDVDRPRNLAKSVTVE